MDERERRNEGERQGDEARGGYGREGRDGQGRDGRFAGGRRPQRGERRFGDRERGPRRERTAEDRARQRDERARAAAKHIGLVRGIFATETAATIESARLYEDGEARDLPLPEPRFETTEVAVEFTDGAAAIVAAKGKAAVLDFASYRNPGGGYDRGAWAQEEALCAESNLFPVLDGLRDVFYTPNRDTMRGELYTDRALYLADVMFMREGAMARRDVVVCAAPNRGRALENHRSEAECDAEMRRRVEAVMRIGATQQVDTYVLGAFGCGVFRNDAATVAGLFKAWIDEHPGQFERVVFAIPGGPNLDTFRSVFGVEAPAPAVPEAPEPEEGEAEDEEDWRQYL